MTNPEKQNAPGRGALARHNSDNVIVYSDHIINDDRSQPGAGSALLEWLHRGGRYAYRWTAHNKRSLWYEVGKAPRSVPSNVDIYFGVHPCIAIPPTNADGEVKEAHSVRSQKDFIAAVNALYSEFDDKDFSSADARRQHVDDLQPAPSARVESGGGEHCYWLLTSPHILDNNSARQEAASVQAGWVQLMGGDDGAKDLARVLRIPGSMNHKYSPARPVKLTKFDTGQTYTFDDLAQLVQRVQAPQPQRTVAGTRTSSTGHSTAYAEAALKSEIEALATAPEGQRNSQLNRSAYALGTLIAAGALARATVEAELRNAASSTGLPDGEIESTMKSGIESGMQHPRTIPEASPAAPRKPRKASTAPQPVVDKFGLNDEGNALATLKRHPGRFLHTESHGWLQYNGRGYWTTELAESTLSNAIIETLNWRISNALQIDPEGKSGSGALVKFCAPNAYRKRGAMDLIKDRSGAIIDRFDTNPDLLNCPNGVLDLRTGDLLPHSPDYRFLHVAGTDYNPDADQSFWLGWLREVLEDEELIDWLQMAVGYTLTGHTNEEIVFYLYGPTRAGKGVFTEAIQGVLGRHLSKEIEFSVLTEKRHPDSQNFALAPLKSARAVMASESNRYERFDEAKLKRISGGNEISCAFKHKDHFNYRPQFKIWLSSNHPVNADPDDDAAWGRLRVIPFPKSYLGIEDKNLKGQMRLPEIRQGILAWAVEGALRWYTSINLGRGLPELPRLADVKQAQRTELDHIQQWMDERTRNTDASEWIPFKELYTDYADWCAENGITKKHGQTLAKLLVRKGFENKNIRGSRFYGIALSDGLLER